MKEKVILIKGGDLKLRVVKRAFAEILPERDFEFVSANLVKSETQIIPKKECIDVMKRGVAMASDRYPDASFFVYMRGRFDDVDGEIEESALVLIADKDNNIGVSQAASFILPDDVAKMIRDGVSFSSAVEVCFNVKGVKEGSGFVGILTNKAVVKEEQYFQPTAIALASCVSKK